MINKDDDRVEEILREVLRLETARLSEPRPRNMPESVVQIIKKIIPANAPHEGGDLR
jgi:hypothetical protein